LDRVKLVAPYVPRVWYACGLQELLTGRPEDAWSSWRRSLELSDAYLPQILATSGAVLRPEALAEKVLPDRPELIVTAALRMYPGPAGLPKRRPLLEKALLLLAAQAEPLPMKDLLTRARSLKGLNQPKDAVPVYQALLTRDPYHVENRLEFARVLSDLGRLEEARAELQFILAQQPRHGPAQALLAIVAAELARKR
jgi:tetratricopeptide (TPR) repeat protein